MKHFRSEYAFQKYKPRVSWRKRILQFFKKKQYSIAPAPTQDSFYYKTNHFKETKKPGHLKLTLFLIFLTAWVVCLAYIPYFKINKVNYSGLNNTTKSELDQFVYENFLNKKSFLPLNNYFFINANKISGDLYKKFAFENVEVKKVFPNQLDINITEKISSIIYDNGKKYFLLDIGGTAIKYLKDVEPYEIIVKDTISSTSHASVNTSSTPNTTTDAITSTEHTPDYKKIAKLFGNYPLVYDERDIDVEIKQENILPTEHIKAIITWDKAAKEQGMIANIHFFAFNNLNSGITIYTDDSWDIIFEPKNNIDAQINTLKEIMPTIKPNQYINLRFGEKLYWK